MGNAKGGVSRYCDCCIGVIKYPAEVGSFDLASVDLLVSGPS